MILSVAVIITVVVIIRFAEAHMAYGGIWWHMTYGAVVVFEQDLNIGY